MIEGLFPLLSESKAKTLFLKIPLVMCVWEIIKVESSATNAYTGGITLCTPLVSKAMCSGTKSALACLPKGRKVRLAPKIRSSQPDSRTQSVNQINIFVPWDVFPLIYYYYNFFFSFSNGLIRIQCQTDTVERTELDKASFSRMQINVHWGWIEYYSVSGPLGGDSTKYELLLLTLSLVMVLPSPLGVEGSSVAVSESTPSAMVST